jgi:CHAT domain-containing protein
VNDQTTAFRVADTFRRMVNKPDLGPAGALRDAQLSLLGSESITALAHPFYWAPFTIFGAGGEQVH